MNEDLVSKQWYVTNPSKLEYTARVIPPPHPLSPLATAGLKEGEDFKSETTGNIYFWVAIRWPRPAEESAP